MRKLILSAAAVLAFAGTTTVKASTLKHSAIIINTVQDSTTKTPVKLEELPAEVKTTLQSDQVKAWTASSAFLVKAKEGEEYYQVNLTKGEEKAFLKIGKDGKIIQ